jgi:hypothetical protein
LFLSSKINNDDRCSLQYSLAGSLRSYFTISQTGVLFWSNLQSTIPIQGAYELGIVVQQNCSSLQRNISTTIIITYRNLSSTSTIALLSTTSSSRIDDRTLYAIIGSISAFLLLVIVAMIFIVLYYHIQRAKHRSPTFFKYKTSAHSTSPYPLDVRDDDSSNGTNSHRTMSSPMHNRLLAGHYKVSETPINTTVEDLLSSYDNRSTSTSSSSSARHVHAMSSNGGQDLFRALRHDQPALDTINENRTWINGNVRPFTDSSVPMSPEESMDIISESHEVDKHRQQLTNATHSTALNLPCCCHCRCLSLQHLSITSTNPSICSSTDLTISSLSACRYRTESKLATHTHTH